MSVAERSVGTEMAPDAVRNTFGSEANATPSVETVTPERDAKLQRLRAFIAEKAREPYNPGNRKVLVFSAFADTTEYLFDELTPALKDELGLECAGGERRPQPHVLSQA